MQLGEDAELATAPQCDYLTDIGIPAMGAQFGDRAEQRMLECCLSLMNGVLGVVSLRFGHCIRLIGLRYQRSGQENRCSSCVQGHGRMRPRVLGPGQSWCNQKPLSFLSP